MRLWRGVSQTTVQFPGQQFVSESDLHYNLHRVNDPQSGRYLTADPLGLAPSPNPSTYVLNPTNWIDPLGLAPHRNEDGTYRVRNQNPAYPPDSRLDELMNRAYDPNSASANLHLTTTGRRSESGPLPASRKEVIGMRLLIVTRVVGIIPPRVFAEGLRFGRRKNL
ncbi:RHS repeat-associated core domain-containing protein [Nocardia cyriacigeorgica]|uniref:RHS repeat-associated core domain-containing protein n=1 Tax=Nocardia cyriacigeorgica TaxID=135487 RepID=A0A6P1D9E4_9NOCA|nr:RHS repeat-associated core domain-containing protein [Nocardia cyriacigeorgica]NEW47117.1 RHS repeat-associated core domain-containing protein [Nocardia cyriacigeorgica]